MQPESQKNMQAVMPGQRGDQVRAERLSAQERSAISRHAARVRWRPQEAKAAKEKDHQELAYLVQQALKDGKELPLVYHHLLTRLSNYSTNCYKPHRRMVRQQML